MRCIASKISMRWRWIFRCISSRMGWNASSTAANSIWAPSRSTTIIQYINRLRVDQAKSLILNTDMNIKDIAQTVGFSSDINFIRVFKKLENRTPTTLRRESRP